MQLVLATALVTLITPNEDGTLSPQPVPDLQNPYEVIERQLRDLLLEALQGISFLTNQVMELKVDIKNLKSELFKSVHLQTTSIARLRAEVQDLHVEQRQKKPPTHTESLANALHQSSKGDPLPLECTSPPGTSKDLAKCLNETCPSMPDFRYAFLKTRRDRH